MAGGLVEPPGLEEGHPRAEKAEPRHAVPRATAEFVHGAGDERERILSTARDGVAGAEDGGDDRCHEGDLPRATEVEAPLEGPGCGGQISTLQEHAAEKMQRKGQR